MLVVSLLRQTPSLLIPILTSLHSPQYLQHTLHLITKMPLPHLASLIQPQPLCCSSRVYLWPRFCTPMDHTDPQTAGVRFFTPRSFVNMRSEMTVHHVGAVTTAAEARVSSGNPDLHLNPRYDDAWDRVLGLTTSDSEHVVTCSMDELKETLRRKKIGLANKGKVPWNKGKKHSAETCARISERTRAAMRDPKIRKKMSESPHSHSKESKEKISSSLKKVWSNRLKWKRSKEKFYISWVESIAETARKGGINEEELNWDSYEVLTREIASQKLQLASEKKADDKEKMKIRAVKRSRKRIEKMVLLAQKEYKQKAKPKAKRKRSRKGRDVQDKLAISGQLNLDDKLIKIQGKKLVDKESSSQSGVMKYLQSALEKFDIESMKREQMRSIVSLADQIQAAKSKRIQNLAGGSAVVT